jgi:hypothetical protein
LLSAAWDRYVGNSYSLSVVVRAGATGAQLSAPDRYSDKRRNLDSRSAARAAKVCLLFRIVVARSLSVALTPQFLMHESSLGYVNECGYGYSYYNYF